jgi:hypothetical protein
MDPLTPEITPATPDAPATPSEAPAATPTPGSPSPVSLNDNDLLSLKVGGKDLTLPWNQAKQGFQFHADYTQKMQALAEERKQLDAFRTQAEAQKAQYEAQLAQARQVMSDPQALTALYMNLQSRQNQPQGPQPITSENLPQLLQVIEQRNQAKFAAWQQEQQKAQFEARLESELDTATRSSLSKHPALAALPGIDDAIAGQVLRMRPANPTEAKQYTQVVVDSMAQKLAQAQEEQAKAALLATNQARLGIEPRGGFPVLPTPKSYSGKDGQGQREADMAAFLNSFGNDPFGRS